MKLGRKKDAGIILLRWHQKRCLSPFTPTLICPSPWPRSPLRRKPRCRAWRTLSHRRTGPRRQRPTRARGIARRAGGQTPGASGGCSCRRRTPGKRRSSKAWTCMGALAAGGVRVPARWRRGAPAAADARGRGEILRRAPAFRGGLFGSARAAPRAADHGNRGGRGT